MRIEYDAFEEWFRSTCSCLEEDEIKARLEVDVEESIDREAWMFNDPATQHDWEVWQAAVKSTAD